MFSFAELRFSKIIFYQNYFDVMFSVYHIINRTVFFEYVKYKIIINSWITELNDTVVAHDFRRKGWQGKYIAYKVIFIK